jgi:hypothetical protein
MKGLLRQESRQAHPKRFYLPKQHCSFDAPNQFECQAVYRAYASAFCNLPSNPTFSSSSYQAVCYRLPAFAGRRSSGFRHRASEVDLYPHSATHRVAHILRDNHSLLLGLPTIWIQFTWPTAHGQLPAALRPAAREPVGPTHGHHDAVSSCPQSSQLVTAARRWGLFSGHIIPTIGHTDRTVVSSNRLFGASLVRSTQSLLSFHCSLILCASVSTLSTAASYSSDIIATESQNNLLRL